MRNLQSENQILKIYKLFFIIFLLFSFSDIVSVDAAHPSNSSHKKLGIKHSKFKKNHLAKNSKKKKLKTAHSSAKKKHLKKKNLSRKKSVKKISRKKLAKNRSSAHKKRAFNKKTNPAQNKSFIATSLANYLTNTSLSAPITINKNLEEESDFCLFSDDLTIQKPNLLQLARSKQKKSLIVENINISDLIFVPILTVSPFVYAPIEKKIETAMSQDSNQGAKTIAKEVEKPPDIPDPPDEPCDAQIEINEEIKNQKSLALKNDFDDLKKDPSNRNEIDDNSFSCPEENENSTFANNLSSIFGIKNSLIEEKNIAASNSTNNSEICEEDSSLDEIITEESPCEEEKIEAAFHENNSLKNLQKEKIGNLDVSNLLQDYEPHGEAFLINNSEFDNVVEPLWTINKKAFENEADITKEKISLANFSNDSWLFNKFRLDDLYCIYESKILTDQTKTVPIKFDTPFGDNDLIIVQTNIGSYIVLSDGVVAYKSNGTVFMPLIELYKLLNFSITSDAGGKKIEGWFIKEKNKFSFDFEKAQVISKKERYTLDPKHVRIVNDEVFVDIDNLEKWFPIRFNFNSLDQVIYISSLESLPIEEALERDKKWDKMNQNKENAAKKDYETSLIKSSYRPISLPFTDIRYGYDHKKTKANGIDTEKTLNILTSGDFLYFTNQLSANFVDSRMSSARLTSGRTDPDGELLGPLHATKFLFGDVFTPESSLISISQTGKGGTITNLPEEYVASDRITINGNMNPGWDVEIYNNDYLLDFKKVAVDGRYQFEDVALSSGLNLVKLIFYGPNGQKREEVRRFLLNEELIKENKFYYNFSANEHGTNLIKVNNSTVANKGVTDPKYGATRRFGEVIYGLTKSTSIAANFASVPLTDAAQQQHDYRGGSFRTSLFGVYGRYDLTRDMVNKFEAKQTSLQTNIFGSNISFKREKYDKNFISETHQISGDPLLDMTEIRVDSPFSIPHLAENMKLTLDHNKNHYASRNSRYNTNGDLSFPVGSKLTLTQGFRSTYDEAIVDGKKRTTTGQTFFNLRIYAPLTIRGTVFYNIKPKKGLTSTSESIGYDFGNNLSINLNHSYQFPQLDQRSSANYSANISKAFEKYILSLGSNYTSNGDYGINANLTFSFGYDPKYKAGIISKTPLSSKGLIIARAFLDDNGNDVYDKEEELLKGVEFETDGVITKTNDAGVAIISQASITSPTIVTMNVDGLADPYWIPKVTAYRVISHAGSTTNIEFPVVGTGDIGGYAKINKENIISSASNVELEIVNKDGKLIKSTKSSYDGFYIFEGIPFGHYKLRISQDQLTRLGLDNNTVYDIEINKENQSVSGFDFIVSIASAVVEQSAPTHDSSAALDVATESEAISNSDSDTNLDVNLDSDKNLNSDISQDSNNILNPSINSPNDDSELDCPTNLTTDKDLTAPQNHVANLDENLDLEVECEEDLDLEVECEEEELQSNKID